VILNITLTGRKWINCLLVCVCMCVCVFVGVSVFNSNSHDGGGRRNLGAGRLGEA
jgi:hypothetical protein